MRCSDFNKDVVMRELLKLAIFGLLSVLAAKADSIVVPADRANQPGDNRAISFTRPGTFQTVYGAPGFPNPVLITAIAFRMDEGSGGLSLEAVIPRLVVQASTYSGTFAA